MSRRSLGVWYAIGSLIALVMLWGGAAQLYATWKSAHAAAPTRPAAIAALAAPAVQESSENKPEAAAGSEEKTEEKKEEPSPMTEVFRWFNFLLIVGGLGYLIKKLLVPFLNERSRLIREDMDRSAKALVDADQRLAMIEDKLKSLDEELASLRQGAAHESRAERERIEQGATADASKILAAAEQEIEAAIKAARQELKLFTSELALGLAEKKIRDSMTPESDQLLLRAFVQDLAGSGNGEAGGAAGPKKQD